MGNARGLVSVVIPAFNASAYIAETLASVLSQTYKEIEVIVVDDASSDGTVDVVKAFANERVKLVQHEWNQGPGAARNTGMAVAEGRWMAFLDSDDQMKPDRVEKLVAAIADAREEFFVADDEWVCPDQPGILTGVQRHLAAFKLNFGHQGHLDLSLLDYQRAGCPHLHSLVPSTVIKENGIRFPVDVRMGEDLEFYTRLFQAGLRLRLLQYPGYMYRVRATSLSQDRTRISDLSIVYRRLAVDNRLRLEEQRYFESLEEKLGSLEEFLRLVDLVRATRVGEAVVYACHHPGAVLECINRLPRAIRWRWRKWIAERLRAGSSG